LPIPLFQAKINNQNILKNVDARYDFEIKIYQSAFAAGLPQDPTGGAYSAPWFSGAASQQGRGGEEKGRERRGGERSPILFLQFN